MFGDGVGGNSVVMYLYVAVVLAATRRGFVVTGGGRGLRGL